MSRVKKVPDLSKFDFNPPSKTFARNFIRPFKLWFAPNFYGLEKLDVSKPAMFVSNHTILGVLDGYPFGIELYLKKGIILRSLADNNHFKIPFWRNLITERLGVVKASRENCAALMMRKESMLVFPGGTREICKKKGEEYILKWSDRNGFVRMAMQYGYDIIPVAAVGAEEAYTITKDANEILSETGFGKFLKFTGIADSVFKGGDLFPPLVKGWGPTVIPKPVKLYFSFGKRISTKHLKSKFEDDAAQQTIKGKVESALQEQFEALFRLREKDKSGSAIIRNVLVR
ncbi:MAG: acyltransferase family protein [Chitinophagales bacterium]|nr:acyltransferase family protein [Chitinophagales bacterium]